MAAPIAPADDVLSISDDAFAYLEEQHPSVEILGAMLNQRIDPGDKLVPCIDIAWTIRGRNGTLYVHPKQAPEWPSIANDEIDFKRKKINAIYEGLAEAPWLVGESGGGGSSHPELGL